MRKGSYKIVNRKLLVELLPSNFRFRSKISCSFNTKLCHVCIQHSRHKVFNYPLSLVFLYSTDNICIPVRPLEYANRLRNKHPLSRCICKETKPNNYPPNGTCSGSYLQKKTIQKFCFPFPKAFRLGTLQRRPPIDSVCIIIIGICKRLLYGSFNV
jgi:hypothetical protein